MDIKPIYASKTFWVNILAIAGIAVQQVAGSDLLDANAQVALLGAINVILRLVTKSAVSLV